MFTAVLKRTRLPFLFIVIALVLLTIAVFWMVDSRYQDFLDNQWSLSQQSLKSTSNELTQHIYHRRQIASILVEEHLSEIKKLIENPRDEVAFNSLNQAVLKFFPEAFNYTLANADGIPLLKDPNQFVGGGCRADLKGFSQGAHLNEIFIHSNPNPLNYHYDILTSINDLGNQTKGVFFVSLDTRNLQRLIGSGQPVQHEFMLVRENKKGVLLEMNAQGTRATLQRNDYLTQNELEGITARVKIPNTLWILIDTIKPEFLANTRQRLERDARLIILIFLIFAVIFYQFVFFNEKKRMLVERTVDGLNQSLENRVLEKSLELNESQAELSHQATHDYLTGLVNRREFERRLGDLIIKSTIDNSLSVILYIDLDQFKVVNDTVGHAVGDEFLREIASLLRSQLRRGDTLARLGGDEFGILLANCDLDHAITIADQLRMAVRDYGFEWNGQSFKQGLSIGVVAIDETVLDVSTVMSCVDASCYMAKDRGRNAIHVYSSDDISLQTQRSDMFWATEALHAIEHERMVLFCQKIHPINAVDKTLWFEILVRLKDEKNNLVLPDMFIPAMERYGGIKDLDKAVLRKSLKFLSKYPDVKFNINLSGLSVGDKKFQDYVIEQIVSSKVQPDRVVLEITETAAVSNLSIAREFIAKMKSLGCKIALDDFGSGMSSFAYLQTLDVDFIKLDGCFVKKMDKNRVDHVMVESITSIAHVMNKQTIAEFVETAQINDGLRKVGVNYGQGYFYHRPELLSIEAIQVNASDNVLRMR